MPIRVYPEDTVTFQLDPETLEHVERGGRWYNMPGRHPVTGVAFNEVEAIDFAIGRGYLGDGYNTADLAIAAAQYRAQSTWDDLPVARDVLDVPYNPLGRAPDGFHYPHLDSVLIGTAQEMVQNGTQPSEMLGTFNFELANDFIQQDVSRAMYEAARLVVGYPPREPGAHQAYSFERILHDGRRSVRYSDQPTPEPGEMRID